MKTTGFKISKPKMASKQSNGFNFAKFQHSLHLVNQYVTCQNLVYNDNKSVKNNTDTI